MKICDCIEWAWALAWSDYLLLTSLFGNLHIFTQYWDRMQHIVQSLWPFMLCMMYTLKSSIRNTAQSPLHLAKYAWFLVCWCVELKQCLLHILFPTFVLIFKLWHRKSEVTEKIPVECRKKRSNARSRYFLRSRFSYDLLAGCLNFHFTTFLLQICARIVHEHLYFLICWNVHIWRLV